MITVDRLSELPHLPTIHIASCLTPWGRVALRVCSHRMNAALNPEAECFIFNTRGDSISDYVGTKSTKRLESFAKWLKDKNINMCVKLLDSTPERPLEQRIKEVLSLFPKTRWVMFPTKLRPEIINSSGSKIALASLTPKELKELKPKFFSQIEGIFLDCTGEGSIQDSLRYCEKHLPGVTRLKLHGGNFTTLSTTSRAILPEAEKRGIAYLPDFITDLEIESDSLTDIEALPSKLLKADLRLTSSAMIRSLPSTLVKLFLTGAKVTNIQPLSMLTELRVALFTHCSFTSLPELPKSLSELMLGYISKLKIIGPLPTHLTVLRCMDSAIEMIDGLPPTLVDLLLSDLPLKNLPDLPETLQTFHADLSSCHFPMDTINVTHLDWKGPPPSGPITLSTSLRELKLKFSSPFSEPVTLPHGLRRLSWGQNIMFQNLPETLYRLQIKDVSLTALPGPIPPSLVDLDLSNLPHLTLTTQLPDTIEVLKIFNCPQIIELPNIPANIRSNETSFSELEEFINRKRRERAITAGGIIPFLASHLL